MSDLFHKDVPIEFIQKTFKVMKDNPQHVFQILTKRADVLLYYDREGWLEELIKRKAAESLMEKFIVNCQF